MKRCSYCKKEKPLEEIVESYPSGLQRHLCRDCSSKLEMSEIGELFINPVWAANKINGRPLIDDMGHEPPFRLKEYGLVEMAKRWLDGETEFPRRKRFLVNLWKYSEQSALHRIAYDLGTFAELQTTTPERWMPIIIARHPGLGDWMVDGAHRIALALALGHKRFRAYRRA